MTRYLWVIFSVLVCIRAMNSKNIRESDPNEPQPPETTYTGDTVLGRVNVNGKTFIIETFFRANWHRAQQFCNYHGMRLASIKSEKEQRALEVELDRIEGNTYWISGNALSKKNNWVWSDGESLSYTNWNSMAPWEKEKNRCIQINTKENEFKWNDRLCSKEKHFICEYENPTKKIVLH